MAVRGTLVSFFGRLLIVEVASDLLHLRSDGSGISCYNIGHQSLLWYTELVPSSEKPQRILAGSKKQFPLLHSLKLLGP